MLAAKSDRADRDVDDENRTTAVGLAHYAYEYLEAAILVDKTFGHRNHIQLASTIPAYFLVLHSIELSMKAYLRHHGVTVRALRSRQYGHDIRACCRKAKELGLKVHFKMCADDMRALGVGCKPLLGQR